MAAAFRGSSTLEDVAAVNADERFVPLVFRVYVRREMIVVIHANRDAEECGNDGHQPTAPHESIAPGQRSEHSTRGHPESDLVGSEWLTAPILRRVRRAVLSRAPAVSSPGARSAHKPRVHRSAREHALGEDRRRGGRNGRAPASWGSKSGEGGIRTHGGLMTRARLASGYHRPLGHLSGIARDRQGSRPRASVKGR